MKKLICIALILTTVFAFAACGQEESVEQDTSPVTMMIALGNGEDYYTALAEQIEENLGIEVEFVYQISQNTTEMQRLYFENNDMQADIVFTASKTDDDLLKDSCVDILSQSAVADHFTQTTIQECTTEDGAIYQLPVSSRLIGITYNETLLNEMGWEVPENFEDMVDLKEKCDEAGIKFAVCDSFATGHGFNWLFHLMGSQWLSTPEGTDWFESFQEGTGTIDEFKAQCDYFKKWTEAGLWGEIYDTDWSGSEEFSKTRALFWYGLVNTGTGYEGPLYDSEGNETETMLSDTYKSIPWISEDGSNNCYTYYDNCWVYVNKELEAPEKSEKLQKVFEILEYMASDEAMELVSDMGKDTYVAVNDYELGADRLYCAYNDNIKNGFIQPWYYNEFDSDSINFTGEAINAYLAGEGSFDDIFVRLDKYNKYNLNSDVEILTDFPEGLDYENTAKLVAVSCAEAVNMTLEANGSSERAEVAIAPYTPEANMMQPWRAGSVCNSVVYKGKMDAAVSNTILPAGTTPPTGVYMTGAEIKEIIDRKLDLTDRFVDAVTGKSTFDSENYGPYPYVCLVKDGADLVDDKEYLVALCDGFLSLEDFNDFTDRGKVLDDLKDAYSLDQGLKSFASEKDEITADDLVL